MARKASLENLKKTAESYDGRLNDLLSQIEDIKEKQNKAWDKYFEREKEIVQENNNDLAAKVKNIFGADITADELEKELGELLLINEVADYIESEKAKRLPAADKKYSGNIEDNSLAESNDDISKFECSDKNDNNEISDENSVGDNNL